MDIKQSNYVAIDRYRKHKYNEYIHKALRPSMYIVICEKYGIFASSGIYTVHDSILYMCINSCPGVHHHITNSK